MDALHFSYWLIKKLNDDGELISPLKLQKLLYYAQGICLGDYQTPLFNDDFEKWRDGSVIRPVYSQYRDYGFSEIAYRKDSMPLKELTDREEAVLNKVVNIYGMCYPSQISEMTHEEDLWNNAKVRNEIIPKESIYQYFSDNFYDNPGYQQQVSDEAFEIDLKQRINGIDQNHPGSRISFENVDDMLESLGI